MAGAKRKVAHFAFHATGIPPAQAVGNASLKNFVEHRLMKGFPLLRGK
jgi:hypothetical protein